MKRRRFYSRQSIRTILTLSVLVAGAAAGVAEQECAATLTPDIVSIAAGSAEVAVTLSDGIGTVARVDVDAESGLTVPGVETEDAQTLGVTLDTSVATAGSWELNLRGESGSCSGTLQVMTDERVTR